MPDAASATAPPHRPALTSRWTTARIAHRESHVKRVRIAPGAFVTISAAMAAKVEHVFATGPTLDQLNELKASEPRAATGLMIGSPKPLGLARRTAAAPTTVDTASSTPAPVDAQVETSPESSSVIDVPSRRPD